MKTVVIYRKWKDTGDVLALFPEEPADATGWFCLSYSHLDQHGSADYSAVMAATLPCSVREVADLHRELRQRGYDVIVRQRRDKRVRICL